MVQRISTVLKVRRQGGRPRIHGAADPLLTLVQPACWCGTPDGHLHSSSADGSAGPLAAGQEHRYAAVGPAYDDAGMSTVEYAVGTVVAAAFAAVLYKIVTGDSVVAGLTNLINSALSTTF